MGGSIHSKEEQMKYLNMRIKMIVDYLDQLDPEETGVEEIDRVIKLLDHLENKCKVFRNSWVSEGEE